MEKTNLPSPEELAGIYVEAVKQKHLGSAELAKAAMLRAAAAQAASAEAVTLLKFSELIA